MKQSIKIECDVSEMRLDAFLGTRLEGFSRNYIQKLIEEGCVTINDAVTVIKKIKPKLGDAIVVEVPDDEALDVLAENIELDIVYEDDDVLVVNKPQGMVVHPAVGNQTGTLVNALMYRSERLSSINGVIRPGIVHRIDKDTSGLLMVAKNDHAHECLAKQLKDKSSLRTYYAIVNGVMKKNSGTIDAHLGRHSVDRKKIAISQDGRHAVTHYEVVEIYRYHTLVRLKLETGRTHQIRVHMASIGHPILGDPVYGLKNEKVKHSGQALHAKSLGFVHPTTGEWMLFDSELPKYFVDLIHKCQKL